jgi:hypothetical protein
MSNHYHVILHINQNQALSLTTEEIHTCWQKLFKGNLLSSRYLRGDTLCDAELQVIEALAEKWRKRLMDISWFMRVLNEGIAREANKEDNCTGRFWKVGTNPKPYSMSKH